MTGRVCTGLHLIFCILNKQALDILDFREDLSYKNVNVLNVIHIIKVRSMQRSGTGAIRTQIHSSNPKWKTTNITNSQNTKRIYGQPTEQLFPKRWPLINLNRTKIIRTHVRSPKF